MLNYRVKKYELEYKDGIPVRQYLNNDPGNPGPDRPGWEDLSLHHSYEGYRDMVWTPIDLPYLDVDLDHVDAIRKDQNKQKDFYETEKILLGLIGQNRSFRIYKNMFQCYHSKQYINFSLFKHLDLFHLTMTKKNQWKVC